MSKLDLKGIKIYVFIIICLVFLNVIIISNVSKDKDIQKDFFRIHVVANSDSISDQLLKLQISKDINVFLENLISKNNVDTKDDTKDLVNENISNILEIANKGIKSYENNNNENPDYLACAKVGKIYYDEKNKDDITMEEGIYDSLQIVLGEGNGQNWWSLIFPYSYEGYYSYDLTTKDTPKSDYPNNINNADILKSENVKFDSIILSFIKKLGK